MDKIILQTIFPFLEDPHDILKYINEPISKENIICYKISGEYGTTIFINDNYGNKLHYIFVNHYQDLRFSPKEFFISSSSLFGLTEHIFSNGTGYYICDNYYLNYLDDKLIMYTKLINEYLQDIEELCDFIRSDKELDFLPAFIFQGIPENALICGSCKSDIIPIDNQCDFCERKLCDNCQQSSDYSFCKCDACNTKYCYYNSKYVDHKCLKIKSNGNGCIECGL